MGFWQLAADPRVIEAYLGLGHKI